MKKSHKYTDLSDRECAINGCAKKIKARVLVLNPSADLCFCHFMELKRNNPRYKGGKKLPGFNSVDKNAEPEVG